MHTQNRNHSTRSKPRKPLRSGKVYTPLSEMDTKFANFPHISDYKEQNEIFSLLGVDPKEDENLRVIDKKGDLMLIHYISSTPSSSNMRGVILDKSKMKIVCNSFPATEEFTYTQFTEGSTNVDRSKLNFTDGSLEVTKAYEGTIVRLMYVESQDEDVRACFMNAKPEDKGGWILSTHKKIDGRAGRWDGPSTFGQQFADAWPADKGDFNTYFTKNMCYVFLLSHPSNRVVCNIDKPTLRLVGIYSPSNDGRMERLPYGKHLFLNQPFIVQKPLEIKSYEDFCVQAASIKWFEYTGLLVCGDKTCFKIVPDEYFVKRRIRGNEPSLPLRYIYLYMRDTTPKELTDMYPEKSDLFADLNKWLVRLPELLTDTYRERYMTKKTEDYERLPQEIYHVIRNTYTNYHPGYSLLANIQYFLAGSSPRHILSMIKYYKDKEGQTPLIELHIKAMAKILKDDPRYVTSETGFSEK